MNSRVNFIYLVFFNVDAERLAAGYHRGAENAERIYGEGNYQ
jgi:hypothetical protein